MNIVTVYPSFTKKGGAEDIALSIACNLSDGNIPVIMQSGKEVFEEYKSLTAKFIKFNIKNIYKYHKNRYIFLSHHRKTTTFLLLISYVFFRRKLRIIHVAHNTFSTLKYLTLFPKYNIAVSETVKQNMNQYFCVPNNNGSLNFE